MKALQGQSMEAVAAREGFFKQIWILDAEIRKSGAKTLLYTWVLRDVLHDQKGLTDAYLEIGKEIGAPRQPAFSRPPVRPNGCFRSLTQKANS